MKFINNMVHDSILLVPNNIKNKVLDYIDDNNKLISIKIMTFNDLKKGLLFDYNNETIFNVMNYLNVNYGVAKDYIKNLYYINEDKYDNDKLNNLLSLKKYLLDKDLLIIDKLFLNLLKSKKKLYIYGFDYIKKFDKYLLNLISELIEIEYIEKENKNLKQTIHEFDTIYDETAYVFENISKLLSDGIPANKIYIANYSEEYSFVFNMLMRQYKLSVYLPSETSLFKTGVAKFFLDNLDNNLDLLLYKIKKKFDYENNKENQIVIDRLSNMLNTYYWCDDIKSIRNLIEEEMKNIKINNTHHENEIVTTNIIDNVFYDDEYVFLIGFNLGSIPKLKRDEDYINDDIKPEYLETSNEYNKAIKEQYIKAISNIKNCTITYKLNSPFATYSKSFLCNLNIFTTVKEAEFISDYSNEYNKLSLSKSLDSLIKFNEVNDNLEILYNSYPDIYKSYDNKFTGIDNKLLVSEIDDKITFSYTNISTFYKCPFRFYVNHILKINEFETTLEQFIGNLFHYVLEETLEDKISVDDAYDEYIKKTYQSSTLTNKEKYFIKSLKEEIRFVVETIKEQYKHSSHENALYEKEIVVEKQRKIKTKIKGFVDKILVLNNSLLVVDYKTTSAQSINTDLLEFGLSTQLPIYLYLLKSLDDNYEVAGLYIQHILNTENNYMPDKNALDEKKKSLKLEGITFDSVSLISKFDNTYEKSEVIKSLSTKDGELKKTKTILSLEERDELCNLMENLIINVIDKVSDGDFKIHPIKIEGKADGCDYCDYKDICFRKFKDFNYQTLKAPGGDDYE
ncbi:MAG: PD-(D/E)XK nuclease family protein [Erysipelotrichales bacterium]|nr:PD-(D/E)XK nuclease family protein [Erysipelotrichales bacterium]